MLAAGDITKNGIGSQSGQGSFDSATDAAFLEACKKVCNGIDDCDGFTLWKHSFFGSLCTLLKKENLTPEACSDYTSSGTMTLYVKPPPLLRPHLWAVN